MIAEIESIGGTYLVTYERTLNHPTEHVWAMLTDNNELLKWFEELRVGELREGGFMNFKMPDGSEQQLEISGMVPTSLFAFDWFGDEIRFELRSSEHGCTLVLKEMLHQLTEQTPKDIAGWHVCLDVVQALLDGQTFNRNEKWKQWYERYSRIIASLNA